MSAFQEIRCSCRCVVENLASQVKGEGNEVENYSCSGRGGSTVSCIGGKKIIIFGGANREMEHFSDVWVIDSFMEENKKSTDVAQPVRLMIELTTTMITFKLIFVTSIFCSNHSFSLILLSLPHCMYRFRLLEIFQVSEAVMLLPLLVDLYFYSEASTSRRKLYIMTCMF